MTNPGIHVLYITGRKYNGLPRYGISEKEQLNNMMTPAPFQTKSIYVFDDLVTLDTEYLRNKDLLTSSPFLHVLL